MRLHVRLALLLLGFFLHIPSAFAGLTASVTLVAGQPGLVYPGEETQFEIVISNNNTTSAISNVAFSTSLPGTWPNGLKISNAASYTCTDPSGPTTSPGAGLLTAAVGTQSIALSGGVIPMRSGNTDGTCVIRVPVVAGSSTGNSATYVYAIGDGAVTGQDGGAVANVGLVSQSINVRAVNVPTITKNFANSNLVLGGAPTTLTITINNPNPIALPGVSITDTFPQLSALALIRVANPPAVTSTCTAGGTPAALTANPGDTAITATGATVAASGSCTLTVSVEAVHTDGLYQTAVQNNTIVGASDVSNSLGLVPANATAQMRTRSPLTLTKAFAHPALASGQADTFTVVFSNAGTSTLTVNSLTDDPIDGVGNAGYGLKVSGAPGMTCSAGGTTGTFVATAGNTGVTQTAPFTVAAGGTCTLTVPFTGTVQSANTPISYTNALAQGAVGTATPGVVSNATSASILIADELRILKSASPASVAPGNPVSYTVTVQNWSAGVLPNVDITDVLTGGQTYLTGLVGGIDYTPSLSGAGCSGLTSTSVPGDTTAVLRIGSVPARSSVSSPGSCNVTFWAMVPVSAVGGSVLSNSLGAGSVCYNAGATCNQSGSNSTSLGVANATLSLTKAFSPAGPLPEGSISRLRITLANQSAYPLTSVTLSDTFPLSGSGSGQLRLANPANAASTCGAPSLTATPSSNSLTMNGATVPARANNGAGAAGTCVLEVDVIGPAGSYANTAVANGTKTHADGSSAAIGSVSSNTATLVYTSSLSASKSFLPASVSSGGKSRVTVRLYNNGGTALTGVGFVDSLPPGMVLASPVNAYATCAGTPVFAGNPGDSSLTLSGAHLAGNGTCDALFDVVATGVSNWVNTLPAGSVVADGAISNQTPVSATLNYTPPDGVSVSKTTNPSTLIFPGQISTLTITLSNGTKSVTGLSLTDYFTVDGTAAAASNGMRIATNPALSTTCPGGVGSAAGGGTSVSVQQVSLAANQSCTLNVNVISATAGGITNYIPAGAIQTDQGMSNSGQATTSLTTQSNIGLTKNFTPQVMEPGQRSRLRLTFFNPSSQPASGVNVTDNLPVGVSVASSPNPQTTCTGASLSFTASRFQISGAAIPAASGGVSATCYAEIDVTSGAAGDYLNTIPAGALSATVGGVSSTNSQAASDTLHVGLPVVVHKAIDGQTLDTGNPGGFTTGSAVTAPGTPKTLTLSLSNPNSTALSGLTLSDTLPSGLVVSTTPNAGSTCGGTVTATPSATTLSLTGGALAGGGNCTVTVDVLSNVSGTYTNTIPAGAVGTNEGFTNQELTQARVLVSSPPSVSKDFDPAVIPAGGTSTLTIYLGNSNASAITLTSGLTDTLPTAPGPVVVAPVPNISKTCPGSVTAVSGAGSVTYANGSQIPPGGCTLRVDVVATNAGIHTNNIPAGALVTSAGSNQNPANATVQVSTQGFISGRVFQDNSVVLNGTFEPLTDTGLAGVVLELRSGPSCAGAVVDTLVTGATGSYVFSNLGAGTYAVCQPSQPAGTVNGATTAGSVVSTNGSTGASGVGSNPTSTTSRIVGIVLNADGSSGEVSGSANNLFSEYALSSIAGIVFLDVNNNGMQNGADTPLSGVTLQLLDGSLNVLQTTTTNAGGAYSFTNLEPGTYTVRQSTQPAGSANGLTVAGPVGNGGTSGTATAVGVLPSAISGIILPPHTHSTGNVFAEIPYGRMVSGTVFLDINNDGLLNGSDYGLAGIPLVLGGTDINGNPVTANTTTNPDGTYVFAGLPEGTYTITQPAQPANTTNGVTSVGSAGGVGSNPTATSSVIAGISLTGGNTVSGDNNFSEQPVASPDLTLSKTHFPASFAEGSGAGYFTLVANNIGSMPTSGALTVVDTLPAGMTLAAPASGTGWVCTGVAGADSVTCTTSQVVLAGGHTTPLTVPVRVAMGRAGQLLTNTAQVSGGAEPAGFSGNNSASDTVAISTTAQVSGRVWRDDNHNNRVDVGEVPGEGWTVELVLAGRVVKSVLTAADGSYHMDGISPASGYQIRFRETQTGLIYGRAVPNEQGLVPANGVRDTGTSGTNTGSNTGNPAGADLTSGDGTLQGLTLLAGDIITEQSLPLDPAGIVYDAVTRAPVAGAVVTLSGPAGFNPATDVIGGSATMTTGAGGFYQFLLTPGAPLGLYTLAVTTYPAGYLSQPSSLIPVCGATLGVGALPDPALIQDSNLPPPSSTPLHVPANCPASSAAFTPADTGSTQYYFSFIINPASSANILNNHIPLDPVGSSDILITKTTPLVNVSVGQLVPYTLVVRNASPVPYTGFSIADTIPPGFKYREGTARRDGVLSDPVVSGRTLTWSGLALAPGASTTFKMLLVVGSGVQPGDYDNIARAFLANTPVSAVAVARVRVVPDPVFDCTDIIGKVFDDENANAYQDKGEEGLANVRLATVNGLLITTDAEGRFHIACGAVPDMERGSNFVLKLDERTLPTGYRLTTENPASVRITRGLMAKLNFGATIHRIVRLDMSGAAFEEGESQLKAPWQAQLGELPKQLGARPSVLRLSYLEGPEGHELALRRLKAVSEKIRSLWKDQACCFELQIEEELVSDSVSGRETGKGGESK